MKKIIIVIVIAANAMFAHAQDKYFTRSGNVSFFSKTDMENIEASNTKGTCVVDSKTGQIEFAVLMKAFEFKKELMMEHFNENYVESDKYPKSTFKGSIANIDEVNFKSDGNYPVKITGQLMLHGVAKNLTADGNFEVKDGKITGKCAFTILLADFNISIPSVVKDNISKSLKIDVIANYESKKM